MKRPATVCFLFALPLAGLFLFIHYGDRPPTQSELLDNFNAHRASYERLRNMLEEDRELLRVASWGVETTTRVGVSVPPTGGFPVDRYKQYLALLSEIGGQTAYRGLGPHPGSVGVLVWSSGWGANTRHVEICWMERQPVNQISDLDTFYRGPKPRSPAFKNIENNWYLWADW